MKRKRKEHRSLDSILFEDDGELEYFDVLNLLPLSNVRLQYDDSADGNFEQRTRDDSRDESPRALEYSEPSSAAEEASASATSGGDATDEEKRTAEKNNSVRADNDDENDEPDKEIRENLDSPGDASSIRGESAGGDRREFEESFGEDSEISLTNKFVDQRVLSTPSSSSSSSSSKFKRERYKADVESFVTVPCEEDRKIEEVEDYKSIWISDGEEQEEMSRRPQILKVVDNDVTKRRHRRSIVEIVAVVEDVPKDKKPQEDAKDSNEHFDVSSLSKAVDNAREDGEVRAEVSLKAEFPPRSALSISVSSLSLDVF